MATKPASRTTPKTNTRATPKAKTATTQDVIETAKAFLMQNVPVGQLRIENVASVPDEGWRIQFAAFVENPSLTVVQGDIKRAIYDEMTYIVTTDMQGRVLGMSTVDPLRSV